METIKAFLFRHRVALLGALAALAAADILWAVGSYLAYPSYLDHGEAAVAAMAWHVFQGLPAFPAFDDPDQISNLYGPVTYLIHGLSFLLFGPGIGVTKAAGLAAAVLIPAVALLTQRRLGAGFALAAMVLAAGFLVLGLPSSIWNRTDPLLALLVAVGVWAMRAADPGRPEWGKALVIGLAGGLAAGLKIHAGVYFVPVVLFFCWPRGAKALAFIAAVGAAAVAAPFALPQFSLPGYLAWFPLMAGKATSWGLLAKVIRYALFYLTPVLFLGAALRWGNGGVGRAEKVYVGAFVLSLVAVLVPASKPGAGWYYLFPFLAVSVDMIVRYAALATRRRALVRGAVGLVAAALLIVSVPVQKRFQRALHWESAEGAAAEVAEIMAAFPNRTIQMGMGETDGGYKWTYVKPLLVFAGHPYTLDAGIRMELSKLGIPLSEGAMRRIETCHTEIWLVPRGERPFAMIGYYGNPVFGEQFKEAFHRHYRKIKGFRYFDAWACTG